MTLFCSLPFPWLLVKFLTFAWQLSNSRTFPGFPDKRSPWTQLTSVLYILSPVSTSWLAAHDWYSLGGTAQQNFVAYSTSAHRCPGDVNFRSTSSISTLLEWVISLPRSRTVHEPKFKILLSRCCVRRPTEYACQVSSTSASGLGVLRFWKCGHRTDGQTDRRLISFVRHLREMTKNAQPWQGSHSNVEIKNQDFFRTFQYSTYQKIRTYFSIISGLEQQIW